MSDVLALTQDLIARRSVTPEDAGLNWAIGKAKPDFVGKRSLARPDLVAKGRKQLIGLLTDDPTASSLDEVADLLDAA